MTPPDLSRSSFEAWLRGKEPGEVVGRGRLGATFARACHCPLATWLAEACGDGFAIVGTSGYQVGDGTRRDLPAWAGSFARAADLADKPTETAADCLVLLSQIPEAA